MIDGSAREDDADKDEGGKRSFNHFYDPLTGLGLTDVPPDNRQPSDSLLSHGLQYLIVPDIIFMECLALG